MGKTAKTKRRIYIIILYKIILCQIRGDKKKRRKGKYLESNLLQN